MDIPEVLSLAEASNMGSRAGVELNDGGATGIVFACSNAGAAGADCSSVSIFSDSTGVSEGVGTSKAELGASIAANPAALNAGGTIAGAASTASADWRCSSMSM